MACMIWKWNANYNGKMVPKGQKPDMRQADLKSLLHPKGTMLTLNIQFQWWQVGQQAIIKLSRNIKWQSKAPISVMPWAMVTLSTGIEHRNICFDWSHAGDINQSAQGRNIAISMQTAFWIKLRHWYKLYIDSSDIHQHPHFTCEVHSSTCTTCKSHCTWYHPNIIVLRRVKSVEG